MDKQQGLLLKKYIDLIHRWRVLLFALLLVALPVALVYYVYTPKAYQSTTLLSYQQQSVNPNKMAPDLTARIQDTVSTLTQIVTSRTNLEAMIASFDLYKDAREKLPLEDVVEMMRKNIEISPSRRGDIFSISFTGEDPGTVVKVTNGLAAKFIEENLKYRAERATETSSYTSNELEMAKATMDRKEAAMRDYKLKYYNEMPEQRQANLSRLTALQEQYEAVQVSILELERTRVLVQEQIALRKEQLKSEAARYGSSMSSPSSPSWEQLKKLRQDLEMLLVTHKENHPEVRRVKKLIENLEAQGVRAPSSRSTGSGPAPGSDKDLVQLQTQLGKITIDIESIELERKQIGDNIKQYEEWVAATPVREAEWSALTREYSQLKSHYDYLVAQDLQAKSMLNLERRQKGSQFKIVDPARYPEKPTQPDFLKIMLVAVGGTMAAGVAMILAIDFLDGSFRDPDDAELALGVPVLATVDFIVTPGEKRKQFLLSTVVVIVLLAGTLMVAALFWYAWSKGKIVI